jgi:DNA transposition AAA+ family ATPase
MDFVGWIYAKNKEKLDIDEPDRYENGELILDSERVKLVIVDEADRLKTAGLEQIRDIYDRYRIGVILIGMPGIEKRLARYPQLYSRVGFVHNYKTISNEEMEHILSTKWTELGMTFNIQDFTDKEALSEIIRITRGNFRLLTRLFTQIDRVMKINNLNVLTKEVVEVARENLIIGSI